MAFSSPKNADGYPTALDFEAAKETSRGHAKVRAVTEEDDKAGDRLDQLLYKITGLLSRRKEFPCC